MIREWTRGDLTVSTDKARLDIETIFEYLSNESYWAKGRPRETIVKSIDHSEVFGVYQNGRQVGMARVVTDYATFAWLCDVFILPEFQQRGLGKWLMTCIFSHPELQGIKLWYLRTLDAHGLYAHFGFTPLAEAGRSMERREVT